MKMPTVDHVIFPDLYTPYRRDAEIIATDITANNA
jgi:hypothetical protein